ncbi:hypothetical protein JSCD16_29810 [Clostridioides difficile]|nr:hypothetical protein JSCD16_29810 [Clostridioides difficile]
MLSLIHIDAADEARSVDLGGRRIIKKKKKKKNSRNHDRINKKNTRNRTTRTRTCTEQEVCVHKE